MLPGLLAGAEIGKVFSVQLSRFLWMFLAPVVDMVSAAVCLINKRGPRFNQCFAPAGAGDFHGDSIADDFFFRNKALDRKK